MTFASNSGDFTGFFYGDTACKSRGGDQWSCHGASNLVFEELFTNHSLSIDVAAPEPSTWVLMAAGFAGLGFLGFRKTLRTA